MTWLWSLVHTVVAIVVWLCWYLCGLDEHGRYSPLSCVTNITIGMMHSPSKPSLHTPKPLLKDTYTHHTLVLVRCWIILGRAWVSSKMHLECPRRYQHSQTTMATTVWAKLHSQTMSYQGDPCYIWAVMPGGNLKPVYTPLSNCHSQPPLSRDPVRLVSWFRKWVAVRAANAFKLNCLHSRSLLRQPCSLAVALYACFQA